MNSLVWRHTGITSDKDDKPRIIGAQLRQDSNICGPGCGVGLQGTCPINAIFVSLREKCKRFLDFDLSVLVVSETSVFVQGKDGKTGRTKDRVHFGTKTRS